MTATPWLAPLLCAAAACSDSGADLASTKIAAQVNSSPTDVGGVVLGLSDYGAPTDPTQASDCLIINSDATASANGQAPISSSYGTYYDAGSAGAEGLLGQCYQPSFRFELGSWPSPLEFVVEDPSAKRIIELTGSGGSGTYVVTRCDFSLCQAL